jgi:hypothetical protein
VAKSSQSSTSFVIDTSQLKTFAKAIRSGDPALAAELRARMHELGDVVGDTARVMSSWSTRIPGSVKVRVGGFAVKVVAGGPGAPDAAPYEHGGAAGAFRHPVFGNTEVWVAQKARPFLAPAVEANAEAVEVLAESIIDDVLRKASLLV